ncbi:hypothetical protein HDU76_011622, partial [Blyttiomyces sp. JEL0837]
KLDGNCVNGKVPLGGNNLVFNGCATVKPTTTNIKPTYTPPKTVDCFPKSMSKYITKPTSLSTPNIYGIYGDARNATCDPALQSRNTHCLGICVVQCVGERYNAWKYMTCSGGRVCKKQTLTPTLPEPTYNYVIPVPTTADNTPLYQPTVTPIASDKCFDYSINEPFIPSTGLNLYKPNADAEGAPCDTEGQVNNLHCAGSCIAQCAQNKWTYLTCPDGLICRADLGAPVCGFPYDYIPPAFRTPAVTYDAPQPTTTSNAVQVQSGVCFPTNIPGYTPTYNALPVPNIYGTQGDALGGPCDTEGQVNNTHCVGACVAQCAQSKWTYLNCPNGMVCRGDLGGPVCGFPQLNH